MANYVDPTTNTISDAYRSTISPKADITETKVVKIKVESFNFDLQSPNIKLPTDTQILEALTSGLNTKTFNDLKKSFNTLIDAILSGGFFPLSFISDLMRDLDTFCNMRLSIPDLNLNFTNNIFTIIHALLTLSCKLIDDVIAALRNMADIVDDVLIMAFPIFLSIYSGNNALPILENALGSDIGENIRTSPNILAIATNAINTTTVPYTSDESIRINAILNGLSNGGENIQSDGINTQSTPMDITDVKETILDDTKIASLESLNLLMKNSIVYISDELKTLEESKLNFIEAITTSIHNKTDMNELIMFNEKDGIFRIIGKYDEVITSSDTLITEINRPEITSIINESKKLFIDSIDGLNNKSKRLSSDFDTFVNTSSNNFEFDLFLSYVEDIPNSTCYTDSYKILNSGITYIDPNNIYLGVIKEQITIDNLTDNGNGLYSNNGNDYIVSGGNIIETTIEANGSLTLDSLDDVQLTLDANGNFIIPGTNNIVNSGLTTINADLDVDGNVIINGETFVVGSNTGVVDINGVSYILEGNVLILIPIDDVENVEYGNQDLILNTMTDSILELNDEFTNSFGNIIQVPDVLDNDISNYISGIRNTVNGALSSINSDINNISFDVSALDGSLVKTKDDSINGVNTIIDYLNSVLTDVSNLESIVISQQELADMKLLLISEIKELIKNLNCYIVSIIRMFLSLDGKISDNRTVSNNVANVLDEELRDGYKGVMTTIQSNYNYWIIESIRIISKICNLSAQQIAYMKFSEDMNAITYVDMQPVLRLINAKKLIGIDFGILERHNLVLQKYNVSLTTLNASVLPYLDYFTSFRKFYGDINGFFSGEITKSTDIVKLFLDNHDGIVESNYKVSPYINTPIGDSVKRKISDLKDIDEDTITKEQLIAILNF